MTEKYIDNDESGIFPKQRDIKLYNTEYQDTYGNICHVLSKLYIKYSRILKGLFREKNKSNRFCVSSIFTIS